MFENLLQLAADEDRVTLNSMASKFPQLKEYFELGERVKPVTDRLKALHPTYADNFEAPVKELEDWRAWRGTKWNDWQAEHTRVQEALATATAEVATLQNDRSAEVTPDEIKEIVRATMKEAGMVTGTDVEAAITKTINEKVGPTLDAKVNGLTMRFEDVFDKIEDIRDRHQGTFAESIRPKQIFEFMKANSITDPEEAWTKMTSGKLAEKTAATIAAEKKAEFDKGVAEGKKEALKAAGQQRNPVDGGDSGGARRPGALMRRAEAKMPKSPEGGVDTSKIPLGKGISRVATQEYYDKKAGAVQ